MDRLRNVLRHVAYPGFTGGAVAFAYVAVGWGWAAWQVGAVVMIAGTVLVEALERAIPWSRRWLADRDLAEEEFRTDVWHLLVSNRFVDLGSLGGLALFTPLGVVLSSILGTSLWPTSWPLLAQAALALVVFELPWYWAHRLGHTVPLLWRLHAIHHSATRLYWWNLSRNHPLDNLPGSVAGVAALALLGVPEDAFALMAAFAAAHGLLQHANADLRTGWLDLVLSTARVHRWHHSRRIDEANANYGTVLALWDHVFGTRRFDPAAVPPEDVGLAPTPAPFPTDFWGQVRAPFLAALWPDR